MSQFTAADLRAESDFPEKVIFSQRGVVTHLSKDCVATHIGWTPTERLLLTVSANGSEQAIARSTVEMSEEDREEMASGYPVRDTVLRTTYIQNMSVIKVGEPIEIQSCVKPTKPDRDTQLLKSIENLITVAGTPIYPKSKPSITHEFL